MIPDFSFVIPVYNRPQEIKELLLSFTALNYSDPFEIVIVEDGSTDTSEAVVNSFSDKLNISYYSKPNSGPGASRNFGMQKAKGNYFIILDSDVILPTHYLATVAAFLEKNFYHCFGGADAAHETFSDFQKAIDYVMTSFLTTGGIRGDERIGANFEPRSFNMGISKEAFQKTKGFGKIHPGEDPDLSQRIRKVGFQTVFIPKAYVYHKRRISWKTFYLQVRKFGMVRPILIKWHPESNRITYWFPVFFLMFVLTSLVLGIILSWFFVLPAAFYLAAIFVGSSLKNKNIKTGVFSVMAVFVQFFGYGTGFLLSTIQVRLFNKDPEKRFPQLFFN